MQFIRQGATHKVVLGPAVAVGDAFTPVTTLSLASADEAEVILHDNGTVVDISGYTFAAITTADGYYHLTLQSGISNTIGHMTVVIQDDSLILPIRADFCVVEEAVYDNLFASSAPGPLAANSNGSGLTEAGGTGDHLTAVTIADLATAAKASVNAEVVDAIATDTYAEPGQGSPSATLSLSAKIGYMYKAWRNRSTQTSSEYALYADDGTTKDQEAAVSDDGTTFERSEVTTGA